MSSSGMDKQIVYLYHKTLYSTEKGNVGKSHKDNKKETRC